MPSYCGDSIDTRPAWESRNEKFHKAWHQARTGGWLPSIQDAAYFINTYIQWYVRQPHRGLEGSPADLFLPNRGPGIDLGQLNNDFLWRLEAKPRNCRVTVWGIDYEGDCLNNLSRKQSIQVKVDTADMSRVWCYTQDSVYLGEAYPVQACHPLARLFGDEVSMAQVKEANKRMARLRKNTKAHIKRLGIAQGIEDSLNVLPFAAKAPKTPIIPAGGKKTAQPDPAPHLSEKEVKRLERLTETVSSEAAAAPKIPRPKFWKTESQRYEWCFRLIHEHGQEASREDLAFMTEFEALPEFKNYRERFEDLKLVFNLNA